MFSDYTTVSTFYRIPRADRRRPASDSEIRFRVKRTLNGRAA